MCERREKLRRLIELYADMGECENFNVLDLSEFILTAHLFMNRAPIFKGLYEDIETLITFVEFIIDHRVRYCTSHLLYQYSLEALGINIALNPEKALCHIENSETALVRLKQLIVDKDDKDYEYRAHEIFNVVNGFELPEWFFHRNGIITLQFFGPVLRHLDPLRLGEDRVLRVKDLISAGVTHRHIMFESGLSSIFEGLTVKEGNEFIEEFLSDNILNHISIYLLRNDLLTFLRKENVEDGSDCV